MPGLCSPTSFFNQRLPADVPIDPSSATYVASLVAQVESAGPGIEFRDFALTGWYAGPETPIGKVWLDAADGTSPLKREMLESVPLPVDLRPPGPFPGDNALAIISYSTDEYFELHGMRYKGVDAMRTEAEVPGCSTLNEPGWHCNSAAGVKNFSKSPGYWRSGDWPGATANWGISGSGIFVWPGAIKVAEAQRLFIPHAIRIEAIGKASGESQISNEFRWPATKTDGESTSSATPQEGMIFKLPSSSVSKPKDAFVRAIARAVNEYGFILTDGAGNVSIKCGTQATVPRSQSYTTDAWKGPADSFGSKGAILSTFANALAEQFPWPDLEVVDSLYRPSSVAPGGLGVGT